MENGLGYFQTRCMQCHSDTTKQYPTVKRIRQLTPEQIYAVVANPSRTEHDQGLTDAQKRRMAEFMGGYRQIGASDAGDPKNFPNQCPSNPQMADPSQGPAWIGWGADIANTRFQRSEAAGFTKADVPKLKLKWAWGFPLGISAYNTPAVASGRVFIGGDTGWIYSLDAKTGCWYWGYKTDVTVRGALSVGPVIGQGTARFAVYFGDAKANVYAVDAQTGRLLWQRRVDDHWVARITAAPKLYNGVLYVPVSSSEEWQSGNPNYECCTGSGLVVALNANTGEQVWRWRLMDDPKPTKKNANGVQLFAPAGGAVWNSPTIDPVRNALYVGTGDSMTDPASPYADGVVALSLTDGKVLWSYTATPNDVFMGGCNGQDKSLACPTQMGPDADIGNSPILRSLPDGRRVLITGIKQGELFALDPDDKGKLLWRAPAIPNQRGNIVWGGAADETTGYYGQGGPGGMSAVDLATGKNKWYVPVNAAGVRANNNAPATMIPGVVFAAGTNGILHALSTVDGSELWSYETSKDYETVNKVAGANGGSVGSNGPVFAGGMMFVGSGNGVSAGDFGNVLLAFGVE
jgi:polyvinyl alcohol dehydrogenase (cytochrome)